MKQQLVTHYLYLVKGIVRRMLPNYSGYVECDDLISYGVIGLMDAIDKYDMDKNINFEYFSKLRIRGEIIDNLRRMDWASVSLRSRIKQMSTAVEQLQAKLKRNPTDEEVAQQMGLDAAKFNKLRSQMHTFNIINFESMVDEKTGACVYDMVSDKKTRDISTDLEKNEFKAFLAKSIDKLNEKEQMVIKLYYYNEFKIKEIASILNISESRVSQIHSNTLRKLKTNIEKIYADKG